MNNILECFVKMKNSFRNYKYGVYENNNIIFVDENEYYLWKLNVVKKNTLKKVYVEYYYDNMKYKTIHQIKDYGELINRHNKLIESCKNTEETFGRNKTYIKSIVDDNDKEYIHILDLLPPKKIILDYHTCELFIDECKFIKITFNKHGKKSEITFEWNAVHNTHIYDILFPQ